jgi:hypothetical protein
VELDDRLLLGLRAHPGGLLDAPLHGRADLLDHPVGVGLRLRREDLADEDLPQRLPQVAVDRPHATLPARRVLGGSLQVGAVEAEAGVHEGGGERGGGAARQVEAEVGLEIVQAERAELLLHLLVEPGLGDVEVVQARLAEGAQVGVPAEGGGERLELLAVHRVGGLVGIAELDGGEGGLGEGGLQAHHGLGAARRLRVAQQLEDLPHVGLVALARLLGLGVVLGVVLGGGQAETAGAGEADHPRGVLGVLAGAEEEEHRTVEALRVEPAEHGGEVRLGFHAGDGRQGGPDGTDPRLLDGRLVHAGGEVVADLLGVGVAPGVRAGRLLQHPPEEPLVVVLRLGVDVPAGLVGGDRVLLQPFAAGELEEVDAGVDRAVHHGRVEARRIGQSGQGSLRRGGLRGRGGGRRLRGQGRKRGERQDRKDGEAAVHQGLLWRRKRSINGREYRHRARAGSESSGSGGARVTMFACGPGG